MKKSDNWQRWEPNGSQPQQLDPWECFKGQDPEEGLQKHDKAQGHWRGEVKVSTARIVQMFKKLFGKEK